MALLVCDGFDVQFANNTVGLANTVYNRVSGDGEISYSSAQKRTGDGSLRINATQSNRGRYLGYAFGSKTEIYFQTALYIASSQTLGGTHVGLCSLISTTGVYQLTFVVDSTTLALRAQLGRFVATGSGLGTTSISLTADTWHVVEYRVVISDTVGVIQIKINGVMALDLGPIDTNNAGGGDVTTILMGNMDTSGSVANTILYYIDDFVVLDTVGSVGNSWPNGAGVLKLDPMTGTSEYDEWTVTGDSAWEAIDDVQTYSNLSDGDTTKIASATAGHKTSVTLEDLVYGGDIHGVMVAFNAKVDTPGSDRITPFVRIDSTDYDLTEVQPGTGYAWHKQVHTLSPASTDEWEETEINGMELGFKVA
jgi:hypothetical protein